MRLFSVPADFQTATIDAYQDLARIHGHSRVAATYGNISEGNLFGSGREIGTIPRVDIERLDEYVRYSRSKGIDFFYTLNPTCMHNEEFTTAGLSKLERLVGVLCEIGVRTFIVSLPSVMEIVRKLNPEVTIKASVTCLITNANRARFFKKLGVQSIVADESVVRDFDGLSRIREEFGEDVELIVNSGCHRDCHYRPFHYNQTSADSIDHAGEYSYGYYTRRCIARLYEDVTQFLRIAWIRPEDLKYYDSVGITRFKIQGRPNVLRGDPVRTARAYFCESFEGNLCDLIFMFAPLPIDLSYSNRALDDFIKPFFEKKGFCRSDCASCHYCTRYAREHLASDELQLRANRLVHELAASSRVDRLIREAAKHRDCQ